jgi:hypothetical protein
LSSPGGGVTTEALLVFRQQDVADRFEQAAMVEPTLASILFT